jgi:predicted porin
VLDGAVSSAAGAASGALNSNRNSFVEVAGNFGSVKAGLIYTLIHDVQGTFDPSGNATAAGFIGGLTNRARQANSLTYTSPVMGGISAQVQMGYGEEANFTGSTTVDKSNSQAFAVKYAAGPIVVMLANEKVTKGALSLVLPIASFTALPAAAAITDTLEDQTATSFGGSYDFGVVKAMYLNTTAKAGSVASNVEIKTQTLGVSAPIGAFTLNASFGNGDATTQADVTKADLKGYQIGVNYALSKRTTAYTIMGKTTFEVPTITLDQKTFAAGVRHTF